MYLKTIKLKNIELKNNIFLAPMAGITDMPFRNICANFGAGLSFSEMISSKGIYYNDEKTKQLAHFDKDISPVAAQIFGSDPNILAFAADKLSKNCDIIDINMGCPVNKIVKNGDGAALLKNPKLIYDIISSIVNITKNKIITVKIRAGFDENSINAPEIAKIVEQAGADLITIHGRTRAQMYSGLSDLNIIKKVKESVNIPVIGNGDIYSIDDAYNMFLKTNVDGIMIARGALGNPWIFKEIITFLSTNKKTPKPTSEELFTTIVNHINLEVDYKGEQIAIKELRKHISWYTKGLPNSSKIRDEINKINKKNDLINTLTKYFYNI